MTQIPKVNGYSKLASLMGSHGELAIFRRFKTLNAQNLLYLQAELVYLEQQLQRRIDADTESGDADRAIYDRDWQSLSEAGLRPDGRPEQWQLIQKIRAILKEYNETLLLQRLLSESEGPLSQDITFLEHWMMRPSMGNVYLLGADSDVYERPDLSDLIATKRHQGLATRIIGDFLPLTEGIYANSISYSDKTIAKVGILISVMCSSTLSVLAFVILYVLQSMVAKFTMVALFTFLFSGALGTFTNPRGFELFVATAGFTVVQSIFVAMTLGQFEDVGKQ